MTDVLEQIRSSIVDIELGKVQSLVREALRMGIPAYEVFTKGIADGMGIVGDKYEKCEFFLTELMGAAQVVDEAMQELGPYLQREPGRHLGKVVIGTVKGDIHDIGKNVVKMLMTSEGFEVYDLETDVPAERFIEKAKEMKVDIVAISSLLTTTMDEMKTIVEELKKAGLRDNLKVLIGGAPITDEYAQEIGADAVAKDAAHGVRICKEWMRKVD